VLLGFVVAKEKWCVNQWNEFNYILVEYTKVHFLQYLSKHLNNNVTREIKHLVIIYILYNYRVLFFYFFLYHTGEKTVKVSNHSFFTFDDGGSF
jgi:hypothetical protein